jgi:hypothetical protein
MAGQISIGTIGVLCGGNLCEALGAAAMLTARADTVTLANGEQIECDNNVITIVVGNLVRTTTTPVNVLLMAGATVNVSGAGGHFVFNGDPTAVNVRGAGNTVNFTADVNGAMHIGSAGNTVSRTRGPMRTV